VATGKAPGFIARHPQEDFCIGHDNARPVTDYATDRGTQVFRGTISQLKITTP